MRIGGSAGPPVCRPSASGIAAPHYGGAQLVKLSAGDERVPSRVHHSEVSTLLLGLVIGIGLVTLAVIIVNVGRDADRERRGGETRLNSAATGDPALVH